MIFSIKYNNSIWIGTGGWLESIPAGVPKNVFATTDINKAYRWQDYLESTALAGKYAAKYLVEEFQV